MKNLRSRSAKQVAACLAIAVAGITQTSEVTGQTNQDKDYQSFDVSSVFDEMSAGSTGEFAFAAAAQSWWDQHVTNPQRRQAQPLPTDIHSLMYLALKYSNEIRIAAEDPVIRQTAITEADSNFDWVRYLNTSLNDTNEPISNALVTGDNSRFFNEETVQVEGGIRRNTRTGGQFSVSQRYGFQDNNSTFFIPSNQATGQLTVNYSQPLLRGRGRAYNNSLVVLSQLDAGIAEDEFVATLQDQLLEITRSYWSLYQERAALAQQTSLFLKTRDIVQLLKARQAIDAQRTQFILASSALESRRSDLIRSRTAVINAETRLRGLINAPELNNAENVELIPVEFPTVEYLPTELRAELASAVQNRPEVHAALKQIKSASIRLGVAQNELLPALNFVTQGFLSGLRGNSDFSGAFGDQFTTGAPSYSVGLQYEMPIGNRLSRSRFTRRAVELRQLQREYALALTAIETEVDIAVRELNTAYQEIQAKGRALRASEAEAKTIEARWAKMADGSGQSGLNLESLLRAQERVTEAEIDYTESLLTYNLGMINLKKATGTLLQTENVSINKTYTDQQGPGLVLDKGPSMRNQTHQQGQELSPAYAAQDQYNSPVLNYGQGNGSMPQFESQGGGNQQFVPQQSAPMQNYPINGGQSQGVQSQGVQPQGNQQQNFVPQGGQSRNLLQQGSQTRNLLQQMQQNFQPQATQPSAGLNPNNFQAPSSFSPGSIGGFNPGNFSTGGSGSR